MITRELFEKIHELHNQKVSQLKIADQLGVPKSSVWRYLHISEYPGRDQKPVKTQIMQPQETPAVIPINQRQPFYRHILLRYTRYGLGDAEILGEIKAMGYTGTEPSLTSFLQHLHRQLQDSPTADLYDQPLTNPVHRSLETGLLLRNAQDTPEHPYPESPQRDLELSLSPTDPEGVASELRKPHATETQLEARIAGDHTLYVRTKDDGRQTRPILIIGRFPQGPEPAHWRQAMDRKAPATLSQLVQAFLEAATGLPLPAKTPQPKPGPNRQQITPEKYDQIRNLADQNLSIREIARQAGVSHHAVKRLIDQPEFAQRPRKSTTSPLLTPYLRHIAVQYADGQTKPAQLLKELTAMDYSGSYATLHRHLTGIRGKPAPQALAEADRKPELQTGLLMREYPNWQTAVPGPKDITQEQIQAQALCRISIRDSSHHQTGCTIEATLTGTGDLYAEKLPNPDTGRSVIHVGRIPKDQAGLQACADMLRQSSPSSLDELKRNFLSLLTGAPLPTETSPETSQETSAAAPAPTGPIADAWQSISGQSAIFAGPALDAVVNLVSDLTAAAGVSTQPPYGPTPLGKGYHLHQSQHQPGYLLVQETPSMTRTAVLAAATDRQGLPGVREPQFPHHVRWWNPGDGDQLQWLQDTLHDHLATFLSETRAR